MFKRLIKSIIPDFNETSLFLMSYSFILVISFNEKLQKEAIDFLFHADDGYPIVAFTIALLFLSGLMLSIVHAFLSRKKSYHENILMLFFGMFINGISGIAAGFYLINTSLNILIIFPLWNIFVGIISVYNIGLLSKYSPDIAESDWLQILIGLFIIFILFIICNFWLKLYWAITFSICITYTTNINSLIFSILKRKTFSTN